MNTNKQGLVTLALTVLLIGLTVAGQISTVLNIRQLETKVTERGSTPIPTQGVKTLAELQNGRPFVLGVTNINHPVVKIMQLGFYDACNDLKVSCKIVGVDGDDVAGLTAIADSLTPSSTSGYSSALYDPAFYVAAARLTKAGIPVVNWHSELTTDKVAGLTAWVSADIKDYAAKAAVAMGEKLGGKGTVAITQGGLNATETPVAETFRATLKAKYPDIKILDTQIEGYDLPKSIAIAASLIQSNPDITGAFSTTGAGPSTWAKGAQEAGKKPGEIVIISMDYSQQNIDLMVSGDVYGLVAQPLYEETYKSVEILVAALKGEKVTFANPLSAPVIKKGDELKYLDYAARAATLNINRLH